MMLQSTANIETRAFYSTFSIDQVEGVPYESVNFKNITRLYLMLDIENSS